MWNITIIKVVTLVIECDLGFEWMLAKYLTHASLTFFSVNTI